MSFTILTMLSKDSPPFNVNRLLQDLENNFPKDDGYRISKSFMPFSKYETLFLSINDWSATFDYEDDSDVLEDSKGISETLGPISTNYLTTAERRIRAVFGDDDAGDYVNEVIYALEFLSDIPGVVLYDPQKGDIFSV
jgi:hypothetical protein